MVQHPEYLYFAMMFLVALPVAWFMRSTVALVVFATWAVGQVTYLLGFPEPETQVVIYAIAGALAWKAARNTASNFTAVMFVPLALISAADALGSMAPYEAWWSIFWIAMTQAAALPFSGDWRTAWHRFKAGKEGAGDVLSRVSHAA